MLSNSIKRVCCLLSRLLLGRFNILYDFLKLLGMYYVFIVVISQGFDS